MYYLGIEPDGDPDDDPDENDNFVTPRANPLEEGEEVAAIDFTNFPIKDPGCKQFLVDRGYWKPLIYLITFTLHFLSVLGILAGGAVVFAYLEDRQYLTDENTNSTTDISNHFDNSEGYLKRRLWKDMEVNFNISVDVDAREKLIQHFRDYIDKENTRRELEAERRTHSDKMFVLQKWLYFVTIATTTIGYGDLSPKTDDGKLFYIFFSIVGIIMMMTLLRRCGTVISAANKNLYNIMDTYVCRRKTEDETVSAILSFLSTLLIFGGYFIAGFWYGKEQNDRDDGWSFLEQIYFWIVTLTTVGFGDLTLSIEDEVHNMSFYLPYRVFGLAILAAIIDALEEVVKAFETKREVLKQKLLQSTISKLNNQMSILQGGEK